MLANAMAVAVLPAEDLERARRFYTEVLGLEEQDTGIEGHTIFQAGGDTKVLIYQRERTKAEHTTLEFVVKDIESVVKALTEKGVKFEQYDFDTLKTDEMGIAALGDRKSAWFVDPEGNIISIST